MRNDIIIGKLIKFTDTILKYCEHLDYNAFAGNSMLVEACVFNISQIGELVKHLDDDFKVSHPSIPWHQLYGLRNRIVHDYEGVNLELVWEIISEDLPELKTRLVKIQRLNTNQASK